MRTLIVGGSGFVGYHLRDFFRCGATSTSGKDGTIKLNIENNKEINEVMSTLKPELVINSAALTDVDACETNAERAFNINGYAVGNLAVSAENIGAKFVHISTDYVFDGKKGNYKEDDRTNPVNTYGKSKELGEKEALKNNGTVIRISAPFGINYARNKTTFFDLLMEKLNKKEQIKALDDQYLTNTSVKDVGPLIERLVSLNLPGIFHIGIKERLSRYEFAVKIAKFFDLDYELIQPVKTSAFSTLKAKRPLDISMNTDKVAKLFKIKTLIECLSEIKDETIKFYGLRQLK